MGGPKRDNAQTANCGLGLASIKHGTYMCFRETSLTKQKKIWKYEVSTVEFCFVPMNSEWYLLTLPKVDMAEF